MASTYFTRDLSGASRQTWTFSCWFKRSKLSTTQTLFSSGTSNNDRSSIFIEDTTSTIRYYSSEGAAVAAWTASEAVLRDPSAWYHFVCKYDTTQATATDRIKFYLNGEAMVHQTGGITAYPAQNNASGYIGSNDTHGLGCLYYGTTATEYWDGYMAHVNFTDGTAYQASDFGETDTNGQWAPIVAPSVTYGTNGFFLKFTDSGSLGTDSSGNGNNWTKNGSGDQVTDTPDNVFATLNGVLTFTSGVLSAGNLIHTGTTGTISKGYSTLAVPSGKWYAEVKNPNGTQKWRAGVRRADYMYFNDNEGIVLDYNFIYKQNTEGGTSEAVSWSGNDHIIGIALNKDDNQVTFYVDGSQIGSVQSLANTDEAYCFFSDDYSSSSPDAGIFQWNFGNPSFSIASGNTDDNGYGNFEYAPPTGYLALCTKNLSSELTLPIGDGSQYFNTVLYSGNNTAKSITGVGFQPDFIWDKNRSDVYNHYLNDSSRGVTKYVNSNATSAEVTITQGITSFDSDGFSVGTDNSHNANGTNLVAWNWKANGGTTSSNTDGSITSTVQANTTAGFSIVTYSGSNSNSTIGHGLNSAPELVIIKNLTLAVNWKSYHKPLGNTYTLSINGTGAATVQNLWQNTTPTNSVVYLTGNIDNSNQSGSNYVAYCFHSVEGYSKFGSYEGNGSNDGPFVYTGFRPAFILYKNADRGLGGAGWLLWDTTRDTRNPTDLYLVASNSNAEGSFDSLDILSNGFKIRTNDGGQNGSSETVIYMAFAENPFVDSTGRPVTAR